MFKFESFYFDTPIVNGRSLDIFVPEKITQKQALFFIHGGGWRAGSKNNYHLLMQAFNQQGFICGATDYRLSGVSAFEQITDIRHGYDLFISELKKRNLELCTVLHGSSAGAHLTMLTGMTAPGGCGEAVEKLRNDWVVPQGIMVQATPTRFEPWEDIFPPIWSSMVDIAQVPYAGNEDVYRRLAPLSYINLQTPPIFFQHADDEHMFPLRFELEFQKAMQKIGRRCEIKIYENAEHGFIYDVTRNVQKKAFVDMLAFIASI